VNRRFIVIGSILVLLALVPFITWPMWKGLLYRPVSTALFEKTKALVERKPELQPMWDNALRDGVLTWTEAKEIWDKAGEKMEPEE
jgi:hypothetical protein